MLWLGDPPTPVEAPPLAPSAYFHLGGAAASLRPPHGRAGVWPHRNNGKRAVRR